MRSRQPRTIPAAIHELGRRLMLDAAIVDRVLIVGGTEGPDAIVVERVAATDSAGDTFRVNFDGGAPQSFPAAEVDQIVVNGLGGDDTITLVRTLPATVDGGAGDDTINGSSNRESLVGGEGADSIIGGKGTDTLEGGAGGDLLSGGSGADIVSGGPGDDTLLGTSGDDFLFGDGGSDSVDGGSGDDQLKGGFRSDTISGGGGNDVVFAHDGNLTISPAADVLSGGSGLRDQLIYDREPAGISLTLDGVANDGVSGENDNVAADFEIFNGTLFDDLIDVSGRAGRLILVGGPGNDTLIGGQGADQISGQEGNDSLDGGPGEDRFFGGTDDDVLTADDGVADIVNGGFGTDTATSDDGLDTLLDVEA